MRRTLSESDSKALLAGHGIELAPERIAATSEEAVRCAEELGFPVVIKLNGDRIAHKTERGLVRLGLADAASAAAAADELLAAALPEDGEVGLLVAPMLRGNREFLAGLSLDPQFGMTIAFGLGGVLAEALSDVVVRPVPIDRSDASEMIGEIRATAVLGPFRGEPAVDREHLADVLVALSDLAVADPSIVAVDLNPLIVVEGRAIPVDALVEIDEGRRTAGVEGDRDSTGARASDRSAGFRALFDPEGVIVAGASTHPGKFGFVSLHNILASGYEGRVFATNRDGATILGIETTADVASIPEGAADLIFVCTPAAANPDLLRQAAARGVKAAFVTSAGYGEAGEDGRKAQDELVALCDDLGILLAGPNSTLR